MAIKNLSSQEYDILNNIAAKTGMDCWFSIKTQRKVKIMSGTQKKTKDFHFLPVSNSWLQELQIFVTILYLKKQISLSVFQVKLIKLKGDFYYEVEKGI